MTGFSIFIRTYLRIILTVIDYKAKIKPVKLFIGLEVTGA